MIVLLMGVSGAGKTTIGERLAAALHARFQEGDAFHPPANVEKMRRGEPLTDQDRLPWLAAIAAAIGAADQAGENAVFACSALRRSYRDILRAAAARPFHAPDPAAEPVPHIGAAGFRRAADRGRHRRRARRDRGADLRRARSSDRRHSRLRGRPALTVARLRA